MGLLVKKLGAGAITIALVGCGGGSESDAKISSPEGNASAKVLSGFVMDGYLKNANVCLDKNNNALCDNADGAIVLTDKNGYYELPIDGDVSNYNLLVEALSGVTEDMDNPGQVLLSDFILETPADRPEIISPLTSMISSIAQMTSVSFDEAAKSLADDLNVSEQTIRSDYVGNSTSESRQVHMLARGLTKVLQSALKSSVGEGGVTKGQARKGSMQRLANLDVAALKQRTDTVHHGANNTDRALADIANDYKNDLTITHHDIKGDKILSRPKAPKNPVVNDSADTFDWAWVKPFYAISDYEYSLDAGLSWQSVLQKPINVGAGSIPKGSVQVRVAAKSERSIVAGSVVVSDRAYTNTLVAPAPTALDLNDAKNELDWVFATGFTVFLDYEYSLDSGQTWQSVTKKPQDIGDIALAPGELRLRVRADEGQGRSAGLMAKSTQPLTVTPPKPTAPVVLRADDGTDILEITLVQGFPRISDYEINLGSGWSELTTNPVQIGNVNIASDTIQVRVKENSTNGRPAGSALVVTQPFTRATNKPSSPTIPVVDDANNQFGWTNVSGFADLVDYEFSTDGGKSFSDVSNKPQDLADSNFAIGDVCVRVKKMGSNAAGSLLCNDKPYSVTPEKPEAPTNGVIDDALDTFDWTWVSGFETIQDYEVRIEAGNWQPIQAKPVQLEDRAYSNGAIEVRVKHNPVNGREAGEILSNAHEFTRQPDAPIAPTSLIVNDTENTLDWTNVAGFSSIADYEWSANSGSTWTPAATKPITVGDIAKLAGEVQIRVRANRQNGRPAGAASLTTQAYTQTPRLPAPSNGAIKIANNGVVTNMVSWDYVNSGENYDRAEYYEFTVDKGATWHAVTSNPQFVGPKAYNKSDVGVRIKQNAIMGKENRAGAPLWATALTGEFGAFEYVPMETWNQSSGFGLSDGWNSNDTKRVAQYDSNGEGEPTFWTYIEVSSSEEVFSKVSGLTTCGMKHWQLPTTAEALSLTTRGKDTLPSYAQNYLISDSEIFWLNEAGTAVAYKNGVKGAYDWLQKRAVAKWQLASGTELVADINTKLSTLDSILSQQSNELTQATSFLTTWLAKNQAKQESYAVLSSEAGVKLSTLKELTESWDTQKTQQQDLVGKLAFEAKIAQSRTDSESVAFIVKVAEFDNKLAQLSKNNVALAAVIEATAFAEKLANIQSTSDSMTSAKEALLAASSGSAIHQATLTFYAALFDLENDYDTTDALKAAFNNALNSIDSQFAALNSAMTDLVAELDSTIAAHNTEILHTTAEDGLNRAHSAGFVVSQSDALIDEQFAKLDSLGRYLPEATSYQQGWRCVLDTNVSGAKRVWALLTSGLPGSKDEVVYDAAGADLPSVIGAGGVIETANNANLCGFNDWKVPHPNQLDSLETAIVENKYDGLIKTINDNVFPNHKGLVPEYDQPDLSGGIKFYYWTSVAASSSKQKAYRFANTNERAGLAELDLDGDSDNQSVTMARLMREDTWDYIASDGSSVADRASAQCAKHPATGEVWQLFENATSSERYKTFNDIQTKLASYQNGMCGKSNWRLPSVDDMRSLIPTNVAVFPHVEPAPSDGDDQAYYVTNGTTGTSLEFIEMELGESSTRNHSSTSRTKFLYRFVAK